VPSENIRACDALNWEYLVQIAAELDEENPPKTLKEGLAILAFGLTQTADEDVRDSQLSEFLHTATDHTSTDATEAVLDTLAKHLRCDLKALREFAKQNGIKLKRFKLW
jgi:hypothetical protein